ncbi:hypothetical protein CPB83DRAFT_842607 [Crepidotus variabilis]|uniref:Uncharacterized protein n=1 Tax=Crepidotus variabilis TaxID=179855 RepID=A0A9P6ETK5_9AGAR|nr:hypothetical protein CPB83DRAFT_842607 [Crepidotus variabilis]
MFALPLISTHSSLANHYTSQINMPANFMFNNAWVKVSLPDPPITKVTFPDLTEIQNNNIAVQSSSSFMSLKTIGGPNMKYNFTGATSVTAVAPLKTNPCIIRVATGGSIRISVPNPAAPGTYIDYIFSPAP